MKIESYEERMQLFLDVDGVLLNFEQAFVRWLNDVYGMGLPPDYETPNWNFTDVLQPEQLKERWHSFLASPEVARMPPLIEPTQFNQLTEQHEVHLLTNFPVTFMEKRRENLESVGLQFDSLHYGGLHGFNGHHPPSKADLVRELRSDSLPALFMDDHPDNCMDVAENCPGVEVWLMSRRFNAEFHHPDVRRAVDWGCLHTRLAD